MLRDPEVCSDVRTLVQMVLADGMQLAPAPEYKPVDDDAPEFARAFEIAQFCERAADSAVSREQNGKNDGAAKN